MQPGQGWPTPAAVRLNVMHTTDPAPMREFDPTLFARARLGAGAHHTFSPGWGDACVCTFAGAAQVTPCGRREARLPIVRRFRASPAHACVDLNTRSVLARGDSPTAGLRLRAQLARSSAAQGNLAAPEPVA